MAFDNLIGYWMGWWLGDYGTRYFKYIDFQLRGQLSKPPRQLQENYSQCMHNVILSARSMHRLQSTTMWYTSHHRNFNLGILLILFFIFRHSRIACSMIKDAEDKGSISPGKVYAKEISLVCIWNARTSQLFVLTYKFPSIHFQMILAKQCSCWDHQC